MMMRTVSPSRSADTFYYHVKLVALRSNETYPEAWNFKMNLMKGIQRLDSTRRPHSFEGNEVQLEDVVTFQMPFYNPTKKKIDFSLLLIELTEGETEVCTATLPVGDHTEDFMKDSTQKIFQGSAEFDDGNFTIDYVLYVEKAKTSLLALLSSGAQAVDPKLSARSSSKMEEVTSARSSKISEAQSPKLEPESNYDKAQPTRLQPTRLPPQRELKPSPKKAPEPEPEPQPAPQPVITPVEVKEEQPLVPTPTSAKKILIRNEPPVRSSKKEQPKRLPIPEPPAKDSPLLKSPKVIPPIPDSQSVEQLKQFHLKPSESEGTTHLKAPRHPTTPIANSIDVTKQRKDQEKHTATPPPAESGGKLKIIIAAVVVAALIFGFIFLRSGAKPAKPKNKSKKVR